MCVLNNQDLNQVTWEQRVMEGNPRYEASQDLPDVRYSQFAEMLGLVGILVDTPDPLAAPGCRRWPPIGRRCWG